MEYAKFRRVTVVGGNTTTRRTEEEEETDGDRVMLHVYTVHMYDRRARVNIQEDDENQEATRRDALQRR